MNTIQPFHFCMTLEIYENSPCLPTSHDTLCSIIQRVPLYKSSVNQFSFNIRVSETQKRYVEIIFFTNGDQNKSYIR